ncbi:transporter [Synergistales bacterium]|nr:transporter [Synergistales bacterium]
MILKTILISVIMALYAAAAAYASDISRLGDAGLSAILNLTELHNPSIAAAREKVEQSRADVGIASSQLGPTLTTGIQARWNDEPSSGAARNVYSASLNLVQTIFAGGTLVANKRAAELALQAVRAESVRTYQNVLNSARVGYFDCQRASAQLYVSLEALELAREHLRQTEALNKAGIAAKGDVLRVKTSVSQAEIDHINAKTNLDLYWTALERIIGVKIPKPGVPHSDSGDTIRGLRPPSFHMPDNVVDKALSQRPEKQAYEFYGERARQLISYASGQRLPNLSVSGQLGLTDEHFWPNADDSWQVQMTLQWTLYDGGEANSQVKKAKASAREVLHQLEDMEAQIRQEAAQAELNLRSSWERLSVAKEQVMTAEEDYAIVLRRYKAQMGTNLDVLDARAALTTSRTAYVNAVYDIAAAQARVIYAIGEDIPHEN